MPSLINQEAALVNNWVTIEDYESELPAGQIIIDSAFWLENQAKLEGRKDIALLLKGDADLEALKPFLNSFDLIAVHFPAFADGRGYSLARLLKERYDFKGEIRAVGDVLIDQLHFMKRCGFDTYDLKEGLSAEKALNYFSTFSDPYQLAYDVQTPIFRRKA